MQKGKWKLVLSAIITVACLVFSGDSVRESIEIMALYLAILMAVDSVAYMAEDLSGWEEKQ